MKQIRQFTGAASAFFIMAFFFHAHNAFSQSQNVGINYNGAEAHGSALLDIDAQLGPYKGLLIPRVALTAANSASPITTPANSLLVYNTATDGSAPNNVIPGYYYWNNSTSKWIRIDSPWITTGSDIYYNTGKVGIGTSTIPKGGLGGAKFAIDGTAASLAGPHLQFTTASDDRPLMHMLNWEHDNIAVNFDAYFDGSAFRSSHTGSSFSIYKREGRLNFNYAAANQGDAFAWTTGMAFTNDGKLGIGTITPSGKLEVKDGNISLGAYSSSASIRYIGLPYYEGSFQDGVGGCSMFFENNGSTNQSIGFKTHHSGVSHTTRMYINYDGKIGIGTTSPAATLDVVGTLKFGSAGTPGDGKVLTSDGSGNATWQSPSASSGFLTTGANNYTSTTSIKNNAAFKILSGASGSIFSYKRSATDTSYMQLYDNSTGAACAIASDNITASGTRNSYVAVKRGHQVDAGAIGILTSMGWLMDTTKFQIFSDGGDFTFLNSGKVGIGTSSPAATLHLSGSSGSTFRMVDGSQVAGRVLTCDADGDATWQAAGAGTVTSVAQSFTGGLISVSGSPITSSGTLALTVAGTSGGIPYFSSSSTWASSGALTANALMIGGGAGSAPSTTTTGSGVLTFLGTPSSSNFFSAITDETGSGAVVGSTNATLTTPSITTSLTLNENASIVLNQALSADGKYTGTTISGTAGTSLVFGDLVYLSVADSRWELADADAASTAGDVLVGICVQEAGDGSATKILLYGTIRVDSSFPTFAVGAPVYISTTAGDVQVAKPSGTDDVIRRLGFAITADEFMFNPSNDYITAQ